MQGTIIYHQYDSDVYTSLEIIAVDRLGVKHTWFHTVLGFAQFDQLPKVDTGDIVNIPNYAKLTKSDKTN